MSTNFLALQVLPTLFASFKSFSIFPSTQRLSQFFYFVSAPQASGSTQLKAVLLWSIVQVFTKPLYFGMHKTVLPRRVMESCTLDEPTVLHELYGSMQGWLKSNLTWKLTAMKNSQKIYKNLKNQTRGCEVLLAAV